MFYDDNPDAPKISKESSQGHEGGRHIKLEKLWQDDAMSKYMKGVHALVRGDLGGFPGLEREFKQGKKCDPASARRRWRGIIVCIMGHQRRLGAVEKKLQRLTGFSVDLQAIAKHYSQPVKNCGWPKCCGEKGVPIAAIIAEEMPAP